MNESSGAPEILPELSSAAHKFERKKLEKAPYSHDGKHPGNLFFGYILRLMIFVGTSIIFRKFETDKIPQNTGGRISIATHINGLVDPSVMIKTQRTVHVGDIIQLDGQVGKIENITLRTTRAVTIDNKVLIIPNHKFLTSILYNWTENGTLTREYVSVGVAYGTDIKLVKKLLIDLTKEFPEILQDPKPDVLFNDFGDNALDLKLSFTLNNSFSASLIKSDVRYKIYEVFNTNAIDIPFPQRTVWLNQVEPQTDD